MSKFKSFGEGNWIEQEGEVFYWVRDDQRSQDFSSYHGLVEAMRNHKIRWHKR